MSTDMAASTTGAFPLLGVQYLAASFFSLAVGSVVLLRSYSAPANRGFFLITFFGAIWLFTFGMQLQATSRIIAQRWNALDYALAVPFISPSVHLFSVLWTDRKDKQRSSFFFFSIAIGLALCGALGSGHLYFVRYESGHGFINIFNWSTLGGSIFGVASLALFLGVGTLALFNLIQARQASRDKVARRQYDIFILGALVGYGGTIDFVSTLGVPIKTTGHIFFTGFISIMSYAILRHRFLNISQLLRRLLLILSIYIGLLIVLIPLFFPYVVQIREKTVGDMLPSLAAMVFGAGAILSIGPLLYSFWMRRRFWLRGYSAAGLAHELKSPLGAIQSAAEILDEGFQSDGAPAQLVTYVRMIRDNSRRLENLVRDLLHLARIDDGLAEVQNEPVDFSALAMETVELFRPRFALTGASIRVQADSSVWLRGDRAKLQQVLSNLLTNALAHAPGAGVEVRVRRGGMILDCSVLDKGPGFPLRKQERIFDRFYQGPSASKGSGIGLTIAKAWVEAHGGKIWAESEGEGKGTTVTFTLPADQS